MKRLTTILAAACLAALAIAPSAQAAFGINSFAVEFENEDGSPATQAGSHPFAMTTALGADIDSELIPEGWLRDFIATPPAGLVGDTTAYERCTNAEYLDNGGEGGSAPQCQISTQVGIVAISASSAGIWEAQQLFNLEPPPGVLARLGFRIFSQNTYIDIGLGQEPPYLPFAASRNTAQLLNVFGAKVQLWGVPADPGHDELRGSCGTQGAELPPGDIAGFEFQKTGKSCPVPPNPKPFLTLPTNCSGPLESSFEATSWAGEADSGSFLGDTLTGCGRLGFQPSIEARPTTRAAQSGSGLEFSLDVADEGLTAAAGLAQSQIEKVVATLPEGMSINASQAEGLEVCSEADLAEETLEAQPGEGCPQASKIGAVEVESPLIEATLTGGLYVAEPYRNLAGDSLIAVYMVFKNKALGINVKQALRVEPDPRTGQLVTVASDIPQLPFSAFRLRFREGARSPLISPPGCGSFEVSAELHPWSGAAPVTATSEFEIVSGPNGSPCPSGTAPFAPRFEAGTESNQAGSYSPFHMRITRQDGEQDLTKLSQTLPPGVVGKIAGVPYCPEAGIARAKSRSGEHGGTAEKNDPSCPAASRIGATTAGAGVGSQLTYVPGSLYLAGPYNGAPLSVVSITPAVAGPFDAGTVVVRFALTLNPVTGEVELDGAASDPIPHILQGIPLNVRDLRASVDRPQLTLNATSCAEEQTRATLFGGGTVLSPLAEHPFQASARYQAAGCRGLGFKPRLAIKLRGAAKRGGHPALRAVVTPRKGDANFSRAVVKLPRSAFLEQAHIRTVCTRVQFAAGAGHGANCPKGAVYGRARAWTPLLDEPLKGPVFLRSSNNKLPDLVIALRGTVDIELSARIDSVRGGIRSTFTNIPDAPVSRFILDMRGAKKGLIVNSRNLCRKPKRNRANSNLRGQNGRVSRTRPVVRAAKCAKRKARGRHRRR